MKKYPPILILLVSVMSFSSKSQIVNTESARMQSDTVGWMGGAGLSFSLRKNTQRIVGFNFETHFQYKTKNDKGLWLILGNIDLLKSGSTKLVENKFAHLRYNRKITHWLRWEFLTQIQNNLITQIDLRYLLGTGPRFKIVKNDKIRIYAATIVLLEIERELTSPVVNHHDCRSSNYISFTWTPRDNLEFISTTYFQPLFRKFSDWRLLNQTVARIKVTNHFKVDLKWDYLHDRFPAGTAPRTTYLFGAGLTFEL